MATREEFVDQRRLLHEARVRMDGVQALRGIASVAVFVHHIDFFVNRHFSTSVVPPLLDLGWVGVDIFFVLSGFIMWRTSHTTPAGARSSFRFLGARVGRVYPPYWAAVAGMGLLALAFPADLRDFYQSSWVRELSLWPGQGDPAMVPAWTLTFEMTFYVLFAGLLLVRPALRWRLIGAWAVAIGVGAVAAGSDPGTLSAVVLNPLAIEFLAGAAIAQFIERVRGRVLPVGMMAVPLIVAGAAAYVTIQPNDSPGFVEETWRVVLVGLPAMCIVATVVAGDLRGTRRVPRVLGALGDRSYSLYLTHWPVMAVASAVARREAGDTASSQLAFVLVSVALSIALTEAMHRWIERPSQRLTKRLLRRLP